MDKNKYAISRKLRLQMSKIHGILTAQQFAEPPPFLSQPLRTSFRLHSSIPLQLIYHYTFWIYLDSFLLQNFRNLLLLPL